MQANIIPMVYVSQHDLMLTGIIVVFLAFAAGYIIGSLKPDLLRRCTHGKRTDEQRRI